MTPKNDASNAHGALVEAMMRQFGSWARRSEMTGPGRSASSGTWLKILMGAAVVSAVGIGATPASAQEIQVTGPLKGAPAVRKLRLYRQGRLEIAPTISFTLLDEYRRTIFAGARLQYNIKDWFGIGVFGAYGALSLTTDLTERINTTAPRNVQTAGNLTPNTNNGFQDQTSKMQWIAGPQIQLVPFRGKLAIFQKLFVDADAYIHGGAAFVGLQERGDCPSGTTKCTDQASFALASRVAIAPTFGLGLTFYGNDFFSIGVEYRAFPFSWNRAGFDTRGGKPDGKFPDGKVDSQDQTFRFNQMVSISVGLFPQKRETSE